MTSNLRRTCWHSIPQNAWGLIGLQHAGSTRGTVANVTGLVCCVTCFALFPDWLTFFFLLLFYKGSNRFHHLKEFPYNYEGETISSVTGASSARSGLKIRARCVVKSVAPCQHVLKVSFFYRPSKLDAWWLIGVYLLFNHEVVFVSEDSSLWKLVNLDKTTIIEESNLCSQSSVLE